MANLNVKKGVIGILTGGGDVPGLNPAIRAVTFRALREGYEVIGFRRGWAGLVEMVRDEKHDNSNNFQRLTEDVVNRAGQPSSVQIGSLPNGDRTATLTFQSGPRSNPVP